MDSKGWTWIAVGLGVAILAVLLLGVVLGWFKKGQLKLVDGDGEVDKTASGAIDETRYLSIAKNVKDNLTGINYQNSYFISVANQLLSLNPNELRLVNNLYLRNYTTTENPSLRAIIMGEFLGGWGNPCTENEKTVLNSPCWLQAKIVEKLNYINA